MSKYSPLGNYLRMQTGSELRLSFADVEEIIEAPLPPSAHNHGEWWANDTTGGHTHSTQWLGAGWAVDGFSLTERWVRFKRNG